MPELPEVETVARQINRAVKGSTIKCLVAYDHKLNLPKKIVFKKSKIISVSRIGKQIIFSLSGTPNKYKNLAVHLRMSGRLTFLNKSQRNNIDSPSHHIRADLELNNGYLTFIDPRRFGTFKFSSSIDTFLPIGIEPLSKSFDSKVLKNLLKNSKTPIKPWLLKQDKVVGIGNIYASEILFKAKISPLRQAVSLSLKEIQRLTIAIQLILKKAIENCGTTFSDFQDAHGVTGSYQKFLKVYDREALKCRSCSAKIKRIVQAQRSTFYCPKCQR
ncbi:MAG: bifunctional DNA-formamidopyrimidine glycosylase/DNA-(apurinic or apyrimidinic site) lyase [Bdellovibrionales bacterium]|nr:bifunctional DNA-formamidopyrimidine glycosylase/DNA-(apurinic or apyrimidinic site) lyase [Bdellovibrionales bacterium]